MSSNEQEIVTAKAQARAIWHEIGFLPGQRVQAAALLEGPQSSTSRASDLTAAFIAEAEKRPLLAGIDPAGCRGIRLRKRHGETYPGAETAAPAEKWRARKCSRDTPAGGGTATANRSGTRCRPWASAQRLLLQVPSSSSWSASRGAGRLRCRLHADAYRASPPHNATRGPNGLGQVPAYTFRREDAREQQHVRALMAQRLRELREPAHPRRRHRRVARRAPRKRQHGAGDGRDEPAAASPARRQPRAHRGPWRCVRTSSCTGSVTGATTTR